MSVLVSTFLTLTKITIFETDVPNIVIFPHYLLKHFHYHNNGMYFKIKIFKLGALNTSSKDRKKIIQRRLC